MKSMEIELQRFSELISETLNTELDEIVGYLELNESTGFYSLEVPAFDNAVFSEYGKPNLSNENGVSVDTKSWMAPNMYSIPQRQNKISCETVHPICPVPWIPNDQHEKNAEEISFGLVDKMQTSNNLNFLPRRKNERILTETNSSENSILIDSFPRNLNEAVSENILPICSSVLVPYDENCLLRSQLEKLAKETNFSDETMTSYNLNCLPRRQNEASSTENHYSVDNINVYSLPRNPPKTECENGLKTFPSMWDPYNRNCFLRSQHETTANKIDFGTEAQNSYNLSYLQKREYETTSTEISSTMGADSWISNSLNSFPRSPPETVCENGPKTFPVMLDPYNRNCFLRNQHETTANKINFGTEAQTSYNLSYLQKREYETTSTEISSTMDADSWISNSLNSFPSSEGDLASTPIRYPVDPKKPNSCNSNLLPRSESETTSIQINSSLDDETHISFNFNCFERNGYETASSVEIQQETDAQDPLHLNLTHGGQHSTIPTLNVSLYNEGESLFNQICISRILKETDVNETTNPQNTEVQTKSCHTKQTEIYIRVMAYLRDTHDACLTFTDTFIDALNDIKILFHGCSYQLKQFQIVSAIFDNLHKVVDLYLERIKNIGWDILQEMIQSEKSMNSCLSQQNILNKACAVSSNSSVPINITQDTMASISMLRYNLFSINDSIQRNIERVNIYRKCKEEIVSIIRQSRAIFYPTQV